MTKETAIEIIAQYDGARFLGDGWYSNVRSCPHNMRIKSMKYTTSLDWLHPVAIKVKDELKLCLNNNYTSSRFYREIEKWCFVGSVSGEYMGLLMAVAYAIQFLNQQKQQNANG